MTTKRKHHYLHWHPRGSSSFTEHEVPAHDPPLPSRDETIFLLHIAAEVEHALMVQYLYAAYSLKPATEAPEDKQAMVKAWKKTLLGIAREEMGHLITVQNLLRLIGAPINLEREDYPFRGDLYPFHFRLEPLSKGSLAKYVLAEMPYMANTPHEIKQIIQRVSALETVPVNRVGAIYLRIMHLFSPQMGEHAAHLAEDDFLGGMGERQAHYVNWGDGPQVLVPEIRDRGTALAAIRELSEQGEGVDEYETAPSHFQRFLDIYGQFPEPGEWEPAYQVPVDPAIARSHTPSGEKDEASITHPQSRMWAQLSSLHYRRLLAYVSHFLQSEGPLVDADGEYTPRGHLSKWAFDQMRRVGQIAAKLASMPRYEGQPETPERAGAPFQMPYTLDLSDRETDRWRCHLDVLNASIALAHRIERSEPGEEDAFLQQLIDADVESEQVMQAAMSGDQLPRQPGGFKRVVRILEESVRGFDIGVHHNFWRGCTRDQFVEMSIFGNPLIARAEGGHFDADNSNLIKALRSEAPFDAMEGDEDRSRYPRMPAHHPPILPERIEFIRQWIANGCPDNEPPGQIGLPGTRPQ
jgi:hypothetical protein